MSSVTFSRSLADLFRLNAEDRLDDVLLRSILRAVDTRFVPLEEQRAVLDAAIEGLRGVGLARINEVLIPAIESVRIIQERGFLIASSTSSAQMANGNIVELEIQDESERLLFAASPFTILTRRDNPDDFAVARTIAYTREDGVFLGQILSFQGDPGPHNDWVIGALAGSTVAQNVMLEEGLTALAAVRQTQVEVALTAKNASDDAARAKGHADYVRDKITITNVAPTPGSGTVGDIWLVY